MSGTIMHHVKPNSVDSITSNNTSTMAGSLIINNFLSGLPSQNPSNFEKWSTDGQKQNITKKPSSYVTTKDIPSQQVIVTDKTNILLRYLHQQFDKKNIKVVEKKRDNANTSTNMSPGDEETASRKRPRFD